MHRLAGQVDVVLTNYRHGVPQKLGIDYDTLAGLNPRLVYSRITGFGSAGPLANARATDVVAGAYAGLIVTNNQVDADGSPGKMTPAYSDYLTGLASALGIVSALRQRDETGRGQLIDTSLLQSALAVQDFYIMREPVTDSLVRDPMMADVEQMRADGMRWAEQLDARSGRGFGGVMMTGAAQLYYNGYETQDGAIMLGCVTRSLRERAREVIGITRDRSDDADFDPTSADAASQIAQWREEIAGALRSQPTQHWFDAFQEAGVPAAPVQMPEELADDPQVEAMGFIRELEHEVTGPQRVMGPVLRMSEAEVGSERASPGLGSGSTEVLAEFGYGDGEIAELVREGVVFRRRAGSQTRSESPWVKWMRASRLRRNSRSPADAARGTTLMSVVLRVARNPAWWSGFG